MGHNIHHSSLTTMVKCRAANCVTRATYGKVHHKPLFCKPLCSEGDRDVVNKACISAGCTKAPSFGIEWRKPLACDEHTLITYTNVVSKRCVPDGCSKVPIFGLVQGKALACAEHKNEDYVDVVHKKCESEGCPTQPTFGLESGKPLACRGHKKDTYTNVVHKRCVSEGCPTQPSFGLVWGKSLTCGEHKKDTYTNVVSKKCVSEGCAVLSTFGLVYGTPLAYRDHKQDDYVDVMNKRCASSVCILLPIIERGRGRYKVEGVLLCGDCMRSMHPDLVKKFQVRTEHFVVDELQRRMPELEDNFLSWDCPLPCAISTERADVLWEIGSTLLHVEVDECATHENDRNRLMRLLAGTDSVDHIVVRTHTHSYDNCKSCVTKSQWVVTCRKKEFDRRMDIVVPEIRRLLAAGESVVKVMFLSWCVVFLMNQVRC